MQLIRKKSERLNKEGVPFTDFYAVWEYEGRPYMVRVTTCFNSDYKLLMSQFDNEENASKDTMHK